MVTLLDLQLDAPIFDKKALPKKWGQRWVVHSFKELVLGESCAQNVSLERSKNATIHLAKHHNKQYHKSIANEIAVVWVVDISLL